MIIMEKKYALANFNSLMSLGGGVIRLYTLSLDHHDGRSFPKYSQVQNSGSDFYFRNPFTFSLSVLKNRFLSFSPVLLIWEDRPNKASNEFITFAEKRGSLVNK